MYHSAAASQNSRGTMGNARQHASPSMPHLHGARPVHIAARAPQTTNRATWGVQERLITPQRIAVRTNSLERPGNIVPCAGPMPCGGPPASCGRPLQCGSPPVPIQQIRPATPARYNSASDRAAHNLVAVEQRLISSAPQAMRVVPAPTSSAGYPHLRQVSCGAPRSQDGALRMQSGVQVVVGSPPPVHSPLTAIPNLAFSSPGNNLGAQHRESSAARVVLHSSPRLSLSPAKSNSGNVSAPAICDTEQLAVNGMDVSTHDSQPRHSQSCKQPPASTTYAKADKEETNDAAIQRSRPLYTTDQEAGRCPSTEQAGSLGKQSIIATCVRVGLSPAASQPVLTSQPVIAVAGPPGDRKTRKSVIVCAESEPDEVSLMSRLSIGSRKSEVWSDDTITQDQIKQAARLARRMGKKRWGFFAG